MLAEERKEKIMDIIEKNRIVKVADLSSRFDATEATIRRDLEELQGQGKLRRIHGGAVFTNPANQDFKYSDLSILHIEEKKRIALRAFEFVHDNDTLLFDGSTTVCELAKLLIESSLSGLSVITNSFHLMTLFSGSSIRVIHTGGELSSGMNCASGTIAEQMLHRIRVDKCFLGTNGIEPTYGYSIPSFADASVKRHMLDASRISFILADHTKFGKSYMAKFADYNGEIDYLITDYLPEGSLFTDTSTQLITTD